MLKELFERRSIRRYTDRPIPEDVLTELLRAAMNAPSARNTQSWRFLVITDRKTLDDIPSLQPYTAMMRQAQAAIMVLGDRNAEVEEGYLYVNCAAAIENLLVEAVHQGLGACWCAIAPKPERIEGFSRYFRLDGAVLPVGIVALGWPAEGRPRTDQYGPDKVSFWRG